VSRRERAELEELKRRIRLARRFVYIFTVSDPALGPVLSDIERALAPSDPTLSRPKPLSFWNRIAYRRLGK
jgi:hypothetical protein